MKAPKKYLVILTLLLTLNSCTAPAPVIIDTAPVITDIAIPEPTEPLKLQTVTWKVTTIADKTYFAISVNDYETLALNLADIKRYILAQQYIIKYYEAQLEN